jgi:hypothetical protein
MRYYFHIRDGDTFIVDPDGTELDRVASAMNEARDHAREIVADQLKAGRLSTGQVFEVTDANGRIVGRLPFADALR